MEKEKHLSFGGHITLINSVLSSLPIYFLSFFKVLKVVVNSLVRIQRNFMWGGLEERRRVAWVCWNKVCRPKELGCLGIKYEMCYLYNKTKYQHRTFILDPYIYPLFLSHLSSFCYLKLTIKYGVAIQCQFLLFKKHYRKKYIKGIIVALIGKWRWRIVNEPKALWCRVFQPRYGKQIANSMVGGEDEVFSKGSLWGRDLGKISDETGLGKEGIVGGWLQRIIECGREVRFWPTVWLGQEKLRDSFGRLFTIL